MKINDVIKNVSNTRYIHKQAEYSMELILNTKDGKGSMTFFYTFSRSVSGIYFYKFSNLDGSRPSIRQLHYKRSIAS